LRAERGFGGCFETLRLNGLAATNAYTVSPFADTHESFLYDSRFLEVPVRQSIEQMASTLVCCFTDPFFVFLHRAPFFLHMLKCSRDFALTLL
jgi:hypothetical protein